jgi:hypothetical protein
MRPKAPGQSTLLLLDVVDILEARKIDYAVVGALAASVYGAVRASVDADVLLSTTIQATGLEQACQAAGFRTTLTRGDLDDPIPGTIRLSDTFGNRVDLLLGLRGLDPQAFLRTVEVPFQGRTLRFIGREDFIAMKVFAAGPLDLADAENAVAAAGESLDVPLVRRLAARFGREASESLNALLGTSHAAGYDPPHGL